MEGEQGEGSKSRKQMRGVNAFHSLAQAASVPEMQDTLAYHLDEDWQHPSHSSPRTGRKPLALSPPYTAFNRQPLSPRPSMQRSRPPSWTDAEVTDHNVSHISSNKLEPTGQGLLNVRTKSRQFHDVDQTVVVPNQGLKCKEVGTPPDKSKCSEVGTLPERDPAPEIMHGSATSVVLCISPRAATRSVLNQPTALTFSSPALSPNASAPLQGYASPAETDAKTEPNLSEIASSVETKLGSDRAYRITTLTNIRTENSASPAGAVMSSPGAPPREEAMRELNEVSLT